MDRKESQHFRLLLLALFATAVMLLYTGVLYNVQVVHHEEYLASSQRSIARVETVTASRGIVTDRNGRTMVSNRSAYHLTFDKSLLKSDEDANSAILRLLELCESRNIALTGIKLYAKLYALLFHKHFIPLSLSATNQMIKMRRLNGYSKLIFKGNQCVE